MRNDLVVDFETYYDSRYSLSKMMLAEYIRHPYFEVICVAVKRNDEETVTFTGNSKDLKAWLQQFDWARSRVIAHNALFDGAILEWVFGFRPKSYLCTMMGSRPHIVPYTGNMSLESVSNYLNIGAKGKEVLKNNGKHRTEFSGEEMLRYLSYCSGDVELSHGVARHLDTILPADEQYLLDLTIKKFTRPKLRLDLDAINDRIESLNADQIELLLEIKKYDATATSIRSRPKFIEKLTKLGVDIPMKATTNSKGMRVMTAALSKKDPEFLALLAHEKEEVRKLVHAKLELGSTIELSRLARFKTLYHLTPEHWLPIPLLYYGAHPGRFSGLDGLNMQNLPRPKPNDPERAALRRSVVAPPGHMIIAADFSNIEARIVATLAGQLDLVEAFRIGADVYSQFASRIYRKEINKKQHPVERFVGKTCILGLGYGMGGAKLQLTLATADTPVPMTLKDATSAVYLYRDTYPRVKMLWNFLEQCVRDYVMAPSGMHVWGPLQFLHERIVLPNGMPIIYHGLHTEHDGGMKYGDKHLWGGSVTENVVQALARIIATRAEIRLAKAGLPCVHQAHDELIFCVPIEHVDACEKVIERVMTDPVPWLPNLPIAVEIHHGPTYGDCK